MNVFPRETAEFQAVSITEDGEPATPAKVAISIEDGRTTTWVDPVTHKGRPSVRIENLEPGTYRVWAKATATGEAPVIDCGTFSIS